MGGIFVGILASVQFDAIAEGVSSLIPQNVLLLDSSLSEGVSIPIPRTTTVVHSIPIEEIPEPATLALLSIALKALVTIRGKPLHN